MSNKKGSLTGKTTQGKARELREKQKKAERRSRNVILAVIAALVVAIIVGIIWVIMSRPNSEETLEGIPEQYRGGEPLVISSKGIGVENPDAPNLDMYFDYTCAGCVYLKYITGPSLTEAAQQGEINLLLHPVITSGGPFNVASTAASLAVIAEQPELFTDLQEALNTRYLEAIENEDGTGLGTTEESLETVKQIARELGVTDSVIEQFDLAGAQQYLEESTTKWGNREVEGREQVASPELVFEGIQIQFSGNDAQEVLTSIQDQMDEIKENNK